MRDLGQTNVTKPTGKVEALEQGGWEKKSESGLQGAHFRFSPVLLRPWTFAPGLALLDFLIRAKLVLHYRNIAEGKIGAALLQHKQSIELFEFE